MNIHDISPFQSAAARVRNRIGQVTFANWLNRSHWIAGAVGILLVIALRRSQEWRSGEIWAVAGLFLIWLAVGLVKGWIARPESLKALSVFDQTGGWKDRFSSAFFFLQTKRNALTKGEELHVNRARKDLGEAIKRLPETLPLPRLSKVWILPLIAVLFSVTPFLRKAIDPGDTTLTEEMIESASAEAERIRKAARDLSGLEALDETEKEELKKLESSVDVAADEIASPEGQTAREVLSTLESRARAAERLAERLGLSNEQWASEEFVRELSQHADTADLAIGIKDKNSNLVAEQSTAIAEILDQDELKRETADRFTIALERALAKATEEDESRPVGERIGNASQKMTARQPKTAAREFDALSKHFRRVTQREEAQKKLEKLAAQLRNSGSQISGSKLESLKKIADTPKPLPDGLKPVEAMPMAQQLQNLMAPQTPQPGQTGGANMPVPGSLSQNAAPGQPGGEKGQDGGKGAMAPVPGQPAQGKDGEPGQGGLAMQQLKESGEEANGFGGMLSAPIPGASPGMNTPGAGLGGTTPGGGNGNGSAGGNEAGSGTMEMFDQLSDIAKAEKESRVTTQLNEGDSEFRAVEGGAAKQEQAKLSRKEIVKNFIDVEEEALDEQTLPLTRRNQVLRYFSEIRRQLEVEE
ncbi:MAG: hypothetical protein P1V20_14115 [Verrucomicrobiales bacterium]|nr:hypothetical protein [Verrucomicrobiales bacterium]